VRVTIYLVDSADDSDIGSTAETVVEEAHMLKRKAVPLENGMGPFTLQGIPTLPWPTPPYFDDQSSSFNLNIGTIASVAHRESLARMPRPL
jgi:hypothetical protein